MKTGSVFLLGLGVLALTLSQRGVANVPHLEMELTGREYYQLLQNRELVDGDVRGPMAPILAMGKRFYDWLDIINQARDAAHKISLSSAATQVAYPVESPKRSNPTIIQTNFDDLKASLPAWVGTALFGGGTLSATLPVSDEEFADWGRKVTFVYEAASRWSLQEPYLNEYKARQVEDIRGYYFLSKETNLAAELAGWNGLDAAKQKALSDWLVGQCFNSGRSESSCRSELTASAAKGDATAFYERYLTTAKDKYDSYFNITQYRNDVTWNGSVPNEFKMPFREPGNAAVHKFLTDNIEDEWKFGGWQLRLAFSPSALANVTFVPGATPHVEDLAGDTITMDANSPLSEYNVQWTIRHEFGHVIGFPDCYQEFYDSNEGAMISYQIDITNLMCSRRGHLQQRHIDELRRVYYQN